MNTLGTTRRSDEPTDVLMRPMDKAPGGADSADFQPTPVIAAEIAFAALLLYLCTQPAGISNNPGAVGHDSVAQGDPAITIPANVAIASTKIAEIKPTLTQTSN